MTLLTDPNLPEPLSINGRKYQMKPATTAERMRWRRAIAANGGRKHGPLALLECMASGVKLLMKDSDPQQREEVLNRISDQRERVLAFFEAFKAKADGAEGAEQRFADVGQMMNEGDVAISDIADAVRQGYPLFGQMLADEATFWPVCGLEALRMFCVGWEGVTAGGEAVRLVRGPAGMAEESLIEVPEGDYPLIGQLYENLISVSPQQRKNLLSRRPSSPAGEISST